MDRIPNSRHSATWDIKSPLLSQFEQHKFSLLSKGYYSRVTSGELIANYRTRNGRSNCIDLCPGYAAWWSLYSAKAFT